MFRKNIQFVLLLIGVLGLSAYPTGRSISRIGDVIVDITADKFTCDKIVCPANTDRCVVIKENDPNNSTVLTRSNTCYSANNDVLKQSKTNEAIDPYSRVKVHIVAFRDGMTSMMNSYDSYTSQDLNGKQFNGGMANWQEEFQREMLAMQNAFAGLYR